MKSLQEYITESSEDFYTLSAKKPSGMFCSESLYQEALDAFGEGAKVINPAYTDYGGTLQDRAVIAWYFENHPDRIVAEKTSWNGENAIAAVLPEMKSSDYFYDLDGLEDKFYELEDQLREEAAERFCDEYDCSNRKAEVLDWLSNFGSAQATDIDYSVSDLKDALEIE